VNQSSADVGQQTKQPENGDDDGDPKQHESLLQVLHTELLVP
jgi:hypothetical protein